MPTIRTLSQHAAAGVFVYVERSEQISKLFAALAAAQGQFEEPKKNRKGQYGEYADLAALRKATRAGLTANGLVLVQTFHLHGEELILNTTLGHSSGDYISSQVPIKTSQNPQATTGYATYMRRMAYSAMLSLSSEDDDDGEAASAAAVHAESEGLESRMERASRAIQQAADAKAVDLLMEKVRQQVAAKGLPADAATRLTHVADQRKAQLKDRGDK